MSLKIYNTLTRKKGEFQPIHPGKVGMYVCGVTVYDMCHIGHARSMVFFDVVYRYLASKGFDITYVRNFTDVDDKIIKRANEVGEDWKELAERFIREFYVDMDALGLRRPTVEPKATEHIEQIQNIVARLLQSGHAYESGGDVIYSVDSFRGYGKLSGKKTDELVAGSRVQIDDKKQNPLDFVLWKAAKPGEPSWESPWGPGRPGWHIECSAMSAHYLGDEFDIHGGGADLAFPHHENEIAQSQAATGSAFARCWIHNGFVNIKSEKMSKSLGNVLNIRDILKSVHPEALRLFLLSSHYRSPLDYNETSIRESSVSLERLYAAMGALDELAVTGGAATELPQELVNIREKFTEVMDDDFNTPKALAILFDAARALNKIFADARNSAASVPTPELLQSVRSSIKETAADVLGLLTQDPAEFQESLRQSRAADRGLSEADIEAQIAERTEARKRKDFAAADRIRNELAEKGIILEDGPQGTTWRMKDGTD